MIPTQKPSAQWKFTKTALKSCKYQRKIWLPAWPCRAKRCKGQRNCTWTPRAEPQKPRGRNKRRDLVFSSASVRFPLPPLFLLLRRLLRHTSHIHASHTHTSHLSSPILSSHLMALLVPALAGRRVCARAPRCVAVGCGASCHCDLLVALLVRVLTGWWVSARGRRWVVGCAAIVIRTQGA